MKTKQVLIALSLYAWSVSAALAFNLVISNNARVVIGGDSWMTDGGPASATTNVTGQRYTDYLSSYLVLNNPATNIFFWNFSRGGASLDEMLTNRVQRAFFPLLCYHSNADQKIVFASMTDNLAPSSNTTYITFGNMFRGPHLMSDGSATNLTTYTGVAASSFYQWIALGEPVEEGVDGDGNQRDRNNATINAGNTFGFLGIDIWNPVSSAWTNDFKANGGTNVQWLWQGGHFASGGAESWAEQTIQAITTDTNIAQCSIRWDGLLLSTNHCVVSSISSTGNKITFTRKDDRLPYAFDVPDFLTGITNDARGGLRLTPSMMHFDLQIVGLPAGNYKVVIDGQTAAESISSIELSNGWNMFTNYAGPYWNQRREVLGLIRDAEGVDRVTLVPIPTKGLQLLTQTFDSNWQAGNRGDLLLQNSDAAMAINATNFTAIHAAAQPTNHTFTVTMIQSFNQVNVGTLNVFK